MIKAALVVILVCAGAVAQSGISAEQVKEQAYAEFNRAAGEFNVEGDAFDALRESMLADPPGYARSLDQQQCLEKLIAANERKLQSLKKLRKLIRR